MRNAWHTAEVDVLGYGAKNARDSNAFWSSTLPPESTAVDEASPLGRAVWRPDGVLGKRCLTFELSGSRRCGAWPAGRMMKHSGPRAKRHAVGSPLERGVRHRDTGHLLNATKVAVLQSQGRKAWRTVGTDVLGYGAANASHSNALWSSTLLPESTAVCEASPLGRAVWRQDARLGKRCLTFELSGRRRCGAWPAGRMMAHSGPRAKCHAVGSPLERGVRPPLQMPQVEH